VVIEEKKKGTDKEFGLK